MSVAKKIFLFLSCITLCWFSILSSANAVTYVRYTEITCKNGHCRTTYYPKPTKEQRRYQYKKYPDVYPPSADIFYDHYYQTPDYTSYYKERCYDPDMATGDDNPCNYPDMQIDR